MPFFKHQAIQMHYEIHEGLVPRDTVALHGNLASNTWWEPAIEVLKRDRSANKKGRLICAEWRGCGKSIGLTEESQLNLPAMAEDYNGLLQELNAKEVTAVGHSTGGLIALYALHQNPALYSRALLLNPVGAAGVPFGPEHLEAFSAMSRDRTFCETVMRGTIYGELKDKHLFQRIVDDAFSVHPLVWHGVAKMLQKVDFHSELASIRQPVLVMHGEHDNILTKEHSVELAEKLPNAKLLELSGLGHSPNVEDPELFVSHLNNFLFG